MSEIVDLQTGDDHRRVVVKWPRDAQDRPIEMQHWINTLPMEDQDLWREVHLEHEKMVSDAMEVGDAWKEFTADGPIINWKSKEVHDQWWTTIPQSRHVIYLEFWQRFRSAFSD